VIMARATGADPEVLAAVLRGAIAEAVPPETLLETGVPVLVLNGTGDIANQTVGRLLEVITSTRLASCEGEHGSTPFQPTFHVAASDFFGERW
jgi:hypothetical protein